MKLEIEREVRQKETIDIELPYYYKHTFIDENYISVTIYGKIENDRHIKISIEDTGGTDKRYYLSVTGFSQPILLGCMGEQYESTKSEFDYIFQKLKDAVLSIDSGY